MTDQPEQPNASPTGPIVLIVRDGWGRNPNPEHNDFNAVRLANTPRCDALLRDYPWTFIHTAGEDVGLPEGTMGNSEVGHQNLGAGRVVDQESVRITKSIRSGEFRSNSALKKALNDAHTARGKTHLLGIASDAGVQGLLEHLYACLDLCKHMASRGQAPPDVYLHLFTDGRDTGPFTGKGYIEQIESACKSIGIGQIATVCGRYYAMDRDNRWERVQQAYDALTGRGEVDVFETAPEAVQAYYDKPTNDSQQGDEFITPRVVADEDTDWKDTRITSGDAVIFYNYRGDRPRELTRAFMQPDFYGNVKPSPDTGEKGFDRGEKLDLRYVCMTAYEASFTEFPGLSVAFPKPAKMQDIAGGYLSQLGKPQFRCAETEKFPHVTFFFNDYRDEPFECESRKMAQSPKVATYDLQPEMSAAEVTGHALRRLESDNCPDFILINYANGDMVGHTGKLEAAIKAVETVDQCVGDIVDATLATNGKLIVTADHGNAEQMWDPDTNHPHTAHTTYDVECIIVDPNRTNDATGGPDKPSAALHTDGKLADVFPTALALMHLDQPAAMTGTSLLK